MRYLYFFKILAKIKPAAMFIMLLFSSFTGFGQWTQVGQTIFGEDQLDKMGWDISLSENGNIIAIGAIGNPADGPPQSSRGQVQVFQNINQNWIQIGADINGDTNSGSFGTSVSLSSNGTKLAVGDPRTNNNGLQSGSVKVYENINGNWIQIGQSLNGQGVVNNFGSAVSLSDDGNILAVGAPNNGQNGNASGNVRVFQNNNGSWIQVGQDINGASTGDQSGSSLELSGDGNRIIIGALGNDSSGLDSGHARVYENNNGIWIQLGEDIAGEATNAQSGRSVSISHNGNQIAIGSPGYTTTGQVRVFSFSNNDWIQIGQDIQGDSFGDNFGMSIKLSGSANRIGISSLFTNSESKPYIKIFDNNNGVWEQIGETINGVEISTAFHIPNMVMSNDGNILSLGVPGVSTGPVRVYEGNGDCNQANLINVLTENSTGCPGTQRVLNITGTLSDATQWSFYSGSCGGTLVGTTTTNQFMVSPSETYTYFIRGEGGCTVPGNCESITINVEDNEDPVANCQNITIQLDTNGNASITANQLDDNSTDNCGIESFTASQINFTNADLGTNNITLTVEDNSGNTNSCNAIVTVEDNISQPQTFVPDDNFETRLQALGYDSGPLDDFVPTANINTVTALDIANTGIIDLTGIEDFIALEQLFAENNAIQTANFSNNTALSLLNIRNNQLNTINVSQNSNLTQLNLEFNLLTTLNVNGLTQLSELYFRDNMVNAIDISALTNLLIFSGYNNSLEMLDASQNPNLAILLANGNNLTFLDVRNGNNTNIGTNMFTSWANPNLTCIFVDDAAYSTANWTNIDAASTFVETQMECDDLEGAVDNCESIEQPFIQTPITIFSYGIGPNVETGDDIDVPAQTNFNLTTIETLFSHPGSLMGAVPLESTTIRFYTDNNGVPGVLMDEIIDIAPITTTEVAMPLGVSGYFAHTFDITSENITLIGGDNGTKFWIVFTDTVTINGEQGITWTATILQNGETGKNKSASQTGWDEINYNDEFDLVYSLEFDCEIITCDQPQVDSLADIDTCDPYPLPALTNGNYFTETNGGGTPLFAGDVLTTTQTVFIYAVDPNDTTCTNESSFTVTFPEGVTALCQDFTLVLDATGNATLLPDDIDNGSQADCGMVALSIDVSNFSCDQLGENTVTLTATNDDGNTASCTATVTVVDITAPTLECTPVTIELDANGNASIIQNQVVANAEDNCEIAMISISQTDFTCDDIGDNNIEIIATDTQGNSTSCTAVVTVLATGSPVASCQNITIALDADGMAQINAMDIDDGSVDSCGNQDLAYTIDQTNFDCTSVGENFVTLTVTQSNGNQDSCTATVIIIDDLAPVIDCEDITVFLDENGTVEIVADDVIAQSFDNCEIVSTSIDQTMFNCSQLGANTVIVSVTDSSGNTSECTATVFIEDSIAPIINCMDITIDLGLDGVATISADDVLENALDNCEIESIMLGTTSFDCSNLGTNEVTVTTTDIAGNTAQCTALVTIFETIDPVAFCQDITIALDADGTASITASDIDGGSTDNCGIGSMEVNIESFDCSNLGENTVTFTVIDISGNLNSCSATVTVIDDLAPVIDCENITVFLDENGSVEISTEDVLAQSFDNCEIVSTSIDQTMFNCSQLGANTVIISATDSSGNTSECSATIQVEDAIVPIISCIDISVDLGVDGVATITTEDVVENVTDNCIIDSLTINITSFDCSDLGTNEIIISATDTAGNTAQCMATVIVTETLAPNAVCQDITIALDANGAASISASDIDSGSTDNCEIAAMTIDTDEFNCDNLGENIINFEVWDVNENMDSCSATVTIIEYQGAPQANCNNVTAVINQNGISIITGEQLSNNSTGLSCNPTYELDIDTFTCNEVGMVIPVTLTITNENGLSSTCISQVHVVDPLSPLMSCPEEPVVIASIAPYQLPDFVENGTVTVSDNCLSQLQIIQEPQPTSFVEAGFTEITITVTDPSGNSVACEFDIFVDPTLNNPSSQFTAPTLKLFPNPAKDVISLSTSEMLHIQTISIVDISGRIIKEIHVNQITELQSINVLELNAAAYFVIVKTSNTIFAEQFIKY